MLMLPVLVKWINGLLNELYLTLYQIFVSGVCRVLLPAEVCVNVQESNGSNEKYK